MTDFILILILQTATGDKEKGKYVDLEGEGRCPVTAAYLSAQVCISGTVTDNTDYKPPVEQKPKKVMTYADIKKQVYAKLSLSPRMKKAKKVKKVKKVKKKENYSSDSSNGGNSYSSEEEDFENDEDNEDSGSEESNASVGGDDDSSKEHSSGEGSSGEDSSEEDSSEDDSSEDDSSTEEKLEAAKRLKAEAKREAAKRLKAEKQEGKRLEAKEKQEAKRLKAEEKREAAKRLKAKEKEEMERLEAKEKQEAELLKAEEKQEDVKRLKAKEKEEIECLEAEEKQEAERLKDEEKQEAAKRLKAEQQKALEMQQKELYALKSVNPFFRVESNTGDGDCFARAAAQALYGDEKKHRQVRSDLCEKILEYPALFKGFLVGTTPEQYAREMKRGGKWLDQPACLALVLLTGRSVEVFCDTTRSKSPITHPSEDADEAFREIVDDELDPIYLFRTGGVHWEHLVVSFIFAILSY